MIGYLKLILATLRNILAKLGCEGGELIELRRIADNSQRTADNSDKMVALLEMLAKPEVDDITLDGSVDPPVAQ